MKDMIRKMMAEGKTFEQIMKEMESAADEIAQENAHDEEVECAREDLVLAICDWLDALGVPVPDDAEDDIDKMLAEVENQIKPLFASDFMKFLAKGPVINPEVTKVTNEPKRRTVVLNENVSPEDFLKAVSKFVGE